VTALAPHIGYDAAAKIAPRGTPKTGQSWTPENRPV
jgi:fumarate hydratase class II